eukprot:m.197859 g.197859  ORF g.197859 m.197859 type:complete len:721 (+) comp20248_c0_seq1:124-2286(+)
MDFSAFSGESFDPKAWVNEALRSAPAGADGAGQAADSHASGLVLKLQMFIQEVNKALETTSKQVVDDLPSVIRRIDNMQTDVGALKKQILVVKEEVEQVERDTAGSMRLLMQLDEVKGRMEATSGALQEADNWETLTAEVDDAFASNDLARISSTLLGMKRSLMVLLDVPDYAQRQKRLEELQDKLEEVVGPLLAAAFTSRSEDDAKAYILALRDIEREDRVHEHYVRCHTAAAQHAWAELCRDETKSLPAILTAFYKELTDMWHQETTWGAVLFGDEVTTVVARLLGEVLQRRVPTVESLLEEDLAAGNAGAEHLERVLQSFKVTVSFAASVEHDETSLDEALFGPFFAQQRQYRRLQMLELHATIPSFAVSELDTQVGAVREFVPKIVSNMQQAVAHCMEFTAGAAASELAFALNDYISRIADKLLDFTEQLTRSAEKGGGSGSGDWASAESAFGLLEASGQIFTQLGEFENELAGKLEQAAVATAVEVRFATLYLDDTSAWRDSVRDLAKGTRGGALLEEGRAHMQRLNTALHELAYRSVLAPLKGKLAAVKGATEWSATGGDTFSLSPLPYITGIGEQLLTLPQQLEPFVAQDDSDMLLVALRAGPLPDALALPDEFDGSTVDHWLESIGTQLANLYLDEVFKIGKLSSKGCAQLSADIEYLCNVMSALDITPPAMILQTNQLVAMDADEFAKSARALDLPADLVARVSKMRGQST